MIEPTHSTAFPRRSGFTLIELVVVIAIIAILVSLTAGAIFKVIDGQNKSNTEQALTTLDNALKQQWQEVVRQAKLEVPCALANTLAKDSSGKIDPYRAKVIHVKLRLQQEFPMSFAEALSPQGLPSLYTSDLNSFVPKPATFKANTTTQPYESSICLLLALRRARGNYRFSADTMGTFSTLQTLADPANGLLSVRLFVDNWGTPVAFFRWPTGNPGGGETAFIELDASNPAPAAAYADPLDPKGYLTPDPKNPNMKHWYYNNSNARQFENTVHSLTSPGAAPGKSPHPYFMVPTIASAGTDRNWGHNFSTMAIITAKANDQLDNLYSFRLRLGARGD